MKKQIILKEYEQKKLEEINKNLCDCANKLSKEDLEKIEKYINKINYSSAIKVTPSSIKAKSFVGVIKYKNIQLEILPKLISENDNESEIWNNLIFMLSYTKNLDIKTSDSAKLSQTSNPFLEVLIREYANSLFDSLKRLTPKNYIREEENLNYLKGKLKFTENIKYNCTNQAKFYCEYDEFSEDCILNQLLYYVANCLYNISNDSKNKSKLKLIIDYFYDIKLIRFDTYKCEKIKLTRNQQMFEKPFKLAKMFISNSSVDLSKNKFENITFLWDMNKLFEEFVYQLIKRKLPEYNPKSQNKKSLLQLSNKNTYVDIMIKDEIIIDTKYKKFEKFCDVSNNDIFQVTSYSLIHDNSEKNIKRAILLYPLYKKGQYPDIKDKLNSELNPYEIHFRTINLMYSDLKKEIQNSDSDEASLVQSLKNIIEGV